MRKNRKVEGYKGKRIEGSIIQVIEDLIESVLRLRGHNNLVKIRIIKLDYQIPHEFASQLRKALKESGIFECFKFDISISYNPVDGKLTVRPILYSNGCWISGEDQLIDPVSFSETSSKSHFFKVAIW